MGIGHSTERGASFAIALLLVAIAWGALAFGAVYPWAYWPLAALCVVAGAIGIAAGRSRVAARSRALPIALIVLGAAIALQLLPLPNDAVALVSPHAPGLAKDLNPAFAAGLEPRHPLSVWPRDTWTGLGLYAAFAALCLGARFFLDVRHATLRRGARRLRRAARADRHRAEIAVEPLSVRLLGHRPVAIAVRALRQQEPFCRLDADDAAADARAAGRRHRSGMRDVKAGWRHKVLWFASEEASRPSCSPARRR